MKATELRIGNWYSSGVDMDTGEQVYNQVLPDLYMNWHVNGCWAKPIPLTEEWLERFGCKKQTSSAKGIGEFDWYELPNGMDLVWVSSSKSWVRIETVESVTIKHVHQLQNLYFALTGEELNQNK